MEKMIYKARYKTNSASEYQPLSEHLEEVGMYVELFADKIGLPKPAFLTGLTHDLGKYPITWQEYLENSHITGKKDKKEDHGTAGGRYLYDTIKQKFGESGELVAQFLAACVMFHHGSGLPDIISPDGSAPLSKRLNKSDEDTNAKEAVANFDVSLKQRVETILADPNFIAETMAILKNLIESKKSKIRFFRLGLTARFLSSCLIDGDRRSSALYDKGISVTKEDAVVKTDWKSLRERLENNLTELQSEGKLNEIRQDISKRCAEFAEHENGIYTLTAATGAGKTLASLRYALAQAERTGKDHVFIIAPYTSILDQNADVIRKIIEPEDKKGQIILEHHSNLEQSEKIEHFDELSETWNVPIIITTMVQFLETLFGAGTRKIRRMHQLANSVIVFDEIQTLPASCTYLFIQAIEFLSQKANSSILLCTATQPGLDKLNSEYALHLPEGSEIIPNIVQHFEDLKRVELRNLTKKPGWTLDEAAQFIEELDEKSILTVVNTKAQAQKLYIKISENHPDWNIVHLSTNMCPAHRRDVISRLKNEYLPNKSKKCVCITTRLIEAGVDIDFDSAIRFFAGFDSIIQTAGRCNRNGELKDSNGNPRNGITYIINIVKEEENISSLPELVWGQKTMDRILREFNDYNENYNNNLLHPDLIANYFIYYYQEMPESLLKHKIGNTSDTVFDLLSDNVKSTAEYNSLPDIEKTIPLKDLRQSFKTAWENFEVIAENTIGVIVPYEKGKTIIAELYAKPKIEQSIKLLQEAQQYSINIYPNKIDEFIKEKIINLVILDNRLTVYTVDEKHYDQNIGLTDITGKMTNLNV